MLVKSWFARLVTEGVRAEGLMREITAPQRSLSGWAVASGLASRLLQSAPGAPVLIAARAAIRSFELRLSLAVALGSAQRLRFPVVLESMAQITLAGSMTAASGFGVGLGLAASSLLTMVKSLSSSGWLRLLRMPEDASDVAWRSRASPSIL